MLKIVEDIAPDMRYGIVDLETNEILISAKSLIELFLIYQEGIYTAIDIETDDSIVEESLRSRQPRKISCTGQYSYKF